MNSNKWLAAASKVLAAITVMLIVTLVLAPGAGAAGKYKVLHKFTYKDGDFPGGGLIFDAAGNLYGTTSLGGLSRRNLGTVFKLAPTADGGWKESVLYSFCSLTNCLDGDLPESALVFDKAGNLYGTTLDGGTSQISQLGTVFKLTENSDGTWTESVLYSFCSLANCLDGSRPTSALRFDADGNLYGTTASGGTFSCGCCGCGTVFKLTHNSNGSWTQSALWNFTGGDDGQFPNGVIFDTAGNLYGTMFDGGNGVCRGFGCGRVFKLMPNPDGSWTASVLYSFAGGTDGGNPFGDLIFDAAGNLYGTTVTGGGAGCSDQLGCGTVFELTPNADGTWKESVLHSFKNHPGASPAAGLTFDRTGNLYGTTQNGGAINGGVVFKLSPQLDGSWTYTALHVFLGKPAAIPSSGLVLDNTGNFYGTTVGSNAGTVFELTP
jgi:uncharacterized repeat protein (TIGR03803 family)